MDRRQQARQAAQRKAVLGSDRQAWQRVERFARRRWRISSANRQQARQTGPGIHLSPDTMTEYTYTDPVAEAEIGVDAQTAGEELARIKAEHRILSPGVVVEESRPDEAPLHPAFEWRDPVAAEQWREHQASQLIRRVRVVPVEAAAPAEPRVSRAAAVPPPDLTLDDHDPLLWELDEAVKAVEAAKAKVGLLEERARRRFDRRKAIQAGVALNDLNEADQLLEDARESLTASRKASTWAGAAV